MSKPLLKSIGAVFAGFLVVVLLSVITDFIVESAGIFPPPTQPEAYQSWMLAVALLYRTIYSVAGGYITAMFAPDRPMRHVLILGILGTIGGILGIIASWSMPTDHWYPIALAILAFPSVWFGGKLKTKSHKLPLPIAAKK